MVHPELDTQNTQGIVVNTQNQEHEDLEAQIQKCNEECMKCMDSFQREGITFSADLCRYCQNGAKLHRLLIHQSKAEKQWGNLDWNSCKFENLYNG